MSVIDIGFVYKWFIDPIITPLQGSAIKYINPGSKIIDIACGTGTFAFKMAGISKFVTGIDLSKSMIGVATKTQKKLNIDNVEFLLKDATRLDDYMDETYDYATLSMAVHQFPPDLRIKILHQLKRIAKQILIIDYAFPLPKNRYKTITYFAERLAGKEHYKCFKNYMSVGGIETITTNAGIDIVASKIRGNGIFTIVKCAGNSVN